MQLFVVGSALLRLSRCWMPEFGSRPCLVGRCVFGIQFLALKLLASELPEDHCPRRQKVDAFYLTCKGTGVSGRLRGLSFTFLTKNPGPFMFKKSERVTWADPGVSREQGS